MVSALALLALPVLSGARGVPGTASTEYSEDRARVLAHFAGAAYCNSDLISSWSCDHCQEAGSFQAQVIYNSKSDMQAYVGLNSENQIVVAFRGSISLTNWIENLYYAHEAAYPHCDGCKVHSGFYETWRSVEDEVVAAISALREGKSPQPQVFVAGHSLGGVVAVLGAAALQYQHSIDVEAVYTYGEPRAGNEAFQQYYNQGPRVSWRVTQYKDPVPHLPLEIMGFTHVQTEVYYEEDNTKYRICDGSGKDLKCSDQWGNGVDLVANHVDDHHHYVGINIDSCNAAGVIV